MLPCHIHDIVHCQHLLGGAQHSIQVQWDVHSHSRGLAAKACDGKCTCRDSENAYAVSLYEVSQQSWEGPELPQDQAQGSQRLPCVKSLRPRTKRYAHLEPGYIASDNCRGTKYSCMEWYQQHVLHPCIETLNSKNPGFCEDSFKASFGHVENVNILSCMLSWWGSWSSHPAHASSIFIALC